MGHHGPGDDGLHVSRKRAGGLSADISPPPLKRQRSLVVHDGRQQPPNDLRLTALSGNSGFPSPAGHSKGLSPPSEFSGKDHQERRPSTTSTLSRPGSMKCNQCGEQSATRYDPFIKCSSCTAHFHDRCRKPPPKKNEDSSAQWRCYRCISKNRIRSVPRNGEIAAMLHRSTNDIPLRKHVEHAQSDPSLNQRVVPMGRKTHQALPKVQKHSTTSSQVNGYDELFIPFEPIRPTSIIMNPEIQVETDFRGAFPDLSVLSIHNMTREEKDAQIAEIKKRPTRKDMFRKGLALARVARQSL